MILEIVGKQTVDYVSKKTDRPVKGITLHCLNKNVQGVTGAAVESIFVSYKSDLYDVAWNYAIGSEVNASFDRRGYLDNIILCKK